VSPEDPRTADEIFLTGTAAEIDPVAVFDISSVGGGGAGDVTGQIIGVFAEATSGELTAYKHWLHHV